MKSSEIRKDLHNYVDNADSKSLKFFQEAIIAYQVQQQKTKGKDIAKQRDIAPMTDNEFFAMIDEAETNIANGKVHTQAEVEDKMRSRHARV